MTRKGTKIRTSTMFDMSGVLLFDSFDWSKKHEVLFAVREIFKPWKKSFPAAGAYIFSAISPSDEHTLLYIGKTEEFGRRLGEHLTEKIGKSGSDNKSHELTNYFASHVDEKLSLGLLVILPEDVPDLETPEGDLVYEDTIIRQIAEQLEAVLLSTVLSGNGRLPMFNDRKDLAKIRDDVDIVRLKKLLDYLGQGEDTCCDYTNFRILDQKSEAAQYLTRKIDIDPSRKAALQQLVKER